MKNIGSANVDVDIRCIIKILTDNKMSINFDRIFWFMPFVNILDIILKIYFKRAVF
jgi:hypothetical protein